LIRRISVLFYQENDLDQIIEELPRIISIDLSFPCVGICLMDETGEDVVLQAVCGLADIASPYARLMLSDHLTRQVLCENTPLVLRDIAAKNIELPPVWSDLGYRSLACVPSRGRVKNLGVLFVASRKPGAINDELLQALKMIGDHLGGEIERKQNEVRLLRSVAESTRASQSKNMFLANMSHELRTPLNSIIGFSEMMGDGLMGAVSSEQKEALSSILTSGLQLLSLINDILDLSKIESGHMHLELAHVDFPALVERCLSIIRERAIRKDITLNLEMDPVTYWVRVDEIRFSQVIFNLLENAVKFTEPGGLITVSVNNNTGNIVDVIHGDQLQVIELTVTDTGIGIHPRDFERIFHPFEQGDQSAAKKHEGSGLGLALCREIVALHGGTIRVESEPGKGSSFMVTIPRVSDPDSPDGVFR